jgi:16S rRNA (cytidine1402-2'-O)-methyltransferase
LGEAAGWYQDNQPKGEFVLVVRGAQPQAEEEPSLEDGLAFVERLNQEGLSLRDAVKRAAKELGLSRNQLYALAMEHKR